MNKEQDMKKTVSFEDNKIDEKLIVNELGYLKIPQAVKGIYGTPTKFPNPDWSIIDDKELLILVYKFKKSDMVERKEGE